MSRDEHTQTPSCSRSKLTDKVLSVLASPVTLPPLLVYGLVVGSSTAVLPRRARRKIRCAAFRGLSMGPWGPAFDRLTWQPWTEEPRCIYASLNAPRDALGEVLLPIAALRDKPVPAGAVRVVIVSDTHGKHHLLTDSLPDGDLLIHCGDLLSRNASIGINSGRADGRSLAAVRDLNAWLGTLPHAHKVVVAGNHDGVLESVGTERARELLSEAIYLEDEVREVGGLRVGGSPWSHPGGSANRAFQSEGGPRLLQSPSRARAEKLDLLVMHCHHDGAAAALRPRVFASGHLHGAHGVSRTPWGLEICASICDGLYRAVQSPVVVDIPASVVRNG